MVKESMLHFLRPHLQVRSPVRTAQLSPSNHVVIAARGLDRAPLGPFKMRVRRKLRHSGWRTRWACPRKQNP